MGFTWTLGRNPFDAHTSFPELVIFPGKWSPATTPDWDGRLNQTIYDYVNYSAGGTIDTGLGNFFRRKSPEGEVSRKQWQREPDPDHFVSASETLCDLFRNPESDLKRFYLIKNK